MGTIAAKSSKRVTLAEIARASGCSKAVVSTVLNGSRGNTMVGAALRERVETMARQAGYVPNHASRSLATGSPQAVGVYITPGPWANVGAEYESAILRGIDQACQEAGYDMIVLNMVGGRGAQDCVRKVAGQRVDGVLVIRARSGSETLGELLEACDNVVAVDFNEPEPASLRKTSFDNAAAMKLAVDHLVELGHRRIGYMGGHTPAPVPDDLARRAGFHRAMADAGLAVDPRHMICRREDTATTAQAWGWDAVDIAMQLGDDMPTAFVAWSDSVAVTAMQRFAQHGVRLPDDLSLVGIDNSHNCSIVWPTLTSVDHPLTAMGAQATRMLIDRSVAHRGEGIAPKMDDYYLFEPKLVVRRTTGPARTGGVAGKGV